MIWPSKLAVYYPYPSRGRSSPWSAAQPSSSSCPLPWCGMAADIHTFWSAGCGIWATGSRHRDCPAGDAGDGGSVYLYPLIGLFILGGWGRPICLDVATEAYLASAAAVLSRWVWCPGLRSSTGDSVSLFEHTVRVTENNSSTHYNLGNVYARKGDFAKAMSHYRQAYRSIPATRTSITASGVILFQREKGEAIAEYQTALRLKPSYADAFFNLGVALAAEGKIDQAMICYRRALELKPQLAAVPNNLGILLARQHRLREAIPHFRAALAINPHDASIRNNLDVALRKESETQTGRDH